MKFLTNLLVGIDSNFYLCKKGARARATLVTCVTVSHILNGLAAPFCHNMKPENHQCNYTPKKNYITSSNGWFSIVMLVFHCHMISDFRISETFWRVESHSSRFPYLRARWRPHSHLLRMLLVRPFGLNESGNKKHLDTKSPGFFHTKLKQWKIHGNSGRIFGVNNPEM